MISLPATKFVPNDKIENKYDVLKSLRRTESVSVYQAREYGGGPNCVILETKIHSEKEMLQLERAMTDITKIVHSQLLRVLYWSTKLENIGKNPNYQIWFIYENFKEGLKDFLSSKSKIDTHIGAGQLFGFIKNTLSLFEYLQAAKIPHKPIKTSNFYSTSEGFAKFDGISICGLSNIAEDSAQVDEDYLAPEIKGKSTSEPNSVSKVFSLGLVILEVASLKSIKGLRTSDSSVKQRISLLQEVFPKDLLGIIKQMLVFEPSKRMSFEELHSKVKQFDSARFMNTARSVVSFDTRGEESKYEPDFPLAINQETVKFRQLHAFWHEINEFADFNLINPKHIIALTQRINKLLVSPAQRSIALSEGRIFIAGGGGSSDKHFNFHEYIPESNKIVSKSSMNEQSRNHPSLCFIDSFIYVAGGCTWADELLDSFERYDADKNYWTKLAPLRRPEVAFALCPLNKVWIYKIGGMTNNNKLSNTIEKYSIPENRWTTVPLRLGVTIPDFKILANSAAVQINNNEIFVFGGNDEHQPRHQTFVLSVTDKADDYITRVNQNSPKDKDLLLRGSLLPNQAICHNHEIFFLKQLGSSVHAMSFSPEKGWNELKSVSL